MAEDEVLFDDVYELCEEIGRYATEILKMKLHFNFYLDIALIKAIY